MQSDSDADVLKVFTGVTELPLCTFIKIEFCKILYMAKSIQIFCIAYFGKSAIISYLLTLGNQ